MQNDFYCWYYLFLPAVTRIKSRTF